MLNLSAFTLLSDRRRVSDANLRYFMRMVRDFDLRTWRVISMDQIVDLTGWKGPPASYARRILASFVNIGLLEMGASNQGKPTFRISPRYLLKGQDLDEWLLDIEKRRQRETLGRSLGSHSVQ